MDLLPGRSYASISTKLTTLRLRGKHRQFTEKEDQILRDEYPTRPLDELLKLLPGRSALNVYRRACLLRVKKIRKPKLEAAKPKKREPKEQKPKAPKPKEQRPIRFRPYEKTLLLEMGARLTLAEMLTLIPHRTPTELCDMARFLGIEFRL
jgi:hypothetical protein